MSTLGERVEAARVMRGVGMNELDRAIGQSSGYTTRIVSGFKQNPELDILRKIAASLRVDFMWLAFEEGRPPSKDDDATVLSAEDEPSGDTPFLRRDPAWTVELEKARGQLPARIPAAYLEKVGDAVVPDAAVTAELIVRVAEILYLMGTAPATGEEIPASRTTDAGPTIVNDKSKKRRGNG